MKESSMSALRMNLITFDIVWKMQYNMLNMNVIKGWLVNLEK